MCVCATTVNAQEVWGTTPETAKPFPTGMWFLTSLENVPEECWFTYTNTATNVVVWGAAPDVNGEKVKQVTVYLCNGGQEAMQYPIDDNFDPNTYILQPGKEYLVKITPKATGIFCMGATPANPNWTEGAFKYYPVDITAAQNLTQSVDPGTTKWFKVKYDYPSQIQIQNFMDPSAGSKIEKIEAIHIECPGGTNVGTGLIGPYIKAGETILGVTASASATDPVSFNFTLNAMTEVNCGNNGGFGKATNSKMTVGQPSSYPDAYYTVDRYFEVPEDGSYTFINHGAKGTILNIGKVYVNEQNRNACDWTDIKTATVGNEDAKIVIEDLKAGDKLVVESDAFDVIGKGAEDLPYLLVTKATESGIADIAADNNTLTANVSSGRLAVSSVLLASGAEVAVYDMLARKVASATAAEGAASIEMDLDVAPGVYVVVVYGKGNSESVKISVK